MRKTIRVTISVELADNILELFRHNMEEAGYEFHPDTIKDYDKFRESVIKAKSRKRMKQKYG